MIHVLTSHDLMDHKEATKAPAGCSITASEIDFVSTIRYTVPYELASGKVAPR